MNSEETNVHRRRLAAIFLLISLMSAMPVVVSEPGDVSNGDGTHTLNWDFSDAADYSVDNVSLGSGHARISTYDCVWNQSTDTDFGNATETNHINISTGEVTLELDTGLQLLANGNFTGGGGSNANNWTGEISGSATTNPSGRYTPGGYYDDDYCWRNWFVDANPGLGYNVNVWTNQTFNLTRIPLDINVSVFHNFTNNSYDIAPGSLAEIHITYLDMNWTYNITSTGWVNSSYPEYKLLNSSDTSIFNHTGLYNISMFTRTDTTYNISHTDAPLGITNFWDNASIEYSAYRPVGNFTSEVLDTGSYAMWDNISWIETLPPGTDMEIFIRTGNSSVPTDSIWSPWSVPLTNASGSDIDMPVGRYIQYRVELSTLTANVTPVLDSIEITYEKYHLAGSVATQEHSPAGIIGWGYFSHQEELNGQAIAYQYSVDSGITWSNMPLDGDMRGLDSGFSIRIRALLSTVDSVVTPLVISMQITYVAVEPSLSLEPVWNMAGAQAGETVRLFIYFNNSANSISSTAWLNVYLDEHLHYQANNSETLTYFQNFVQDDNLNIRKYVFADIPAGTNTMWIDAVMGSNIDDGTMLQTTVTLDYLDPIGNRVESKLELAGIRADSPAITADLIALNNTADVDDTVHYQIQINNTGRGSAPMVWLNGTADDRFLVPGQESQNISIQITGLDGLSSRKFFFNVTLRDNVVQDSTIPMGLDVQYSDISGFIRQTSTGQSGIRASLRSNMSISMTTQTSQVNSSSLFVVTVHYDNYGYGSADIVYINMSLPAGFEIDSSSEEFNSFGQFYAWELENIGPGPHSFTITFRANTMNQDIFTSNFQMYMQVTDPVDGKLGLESSNSLSIDNVRIYTFWENIYWPWSGFAMALAGFLVIYGLWNYLKPEPPTIDDVFIIYRDGRLISHRKSRSGMRAELDGDLVSAMLTVVQEFISESLSKDSTDKVKKMEFGDRELYVERSDNINLAIIYSGTMNRKLEEQIVNLTRMIEIEHPFLSTWDGRMTQLKDIDPQLDELVSKWQHLNASEDYSPDTDA